MRKQKTKMVTALVDTFAWSSRRLINIVRLPRGRIEHVLQIPEIWCLIVDNEQLGMKRRDHPVEAVVGRIGVFEHPLKVRVHRAQLFHARAYFLGEVVNAELG